MPKKNTEEEKTVLSLKAVDAELTAIEAAIMRHEKREAELFAEKERLLNMVLGAAEEEKPEEEPETDLKVGDYVKWGAPAKFGRITFASKKPIMPNLPIMADMMDSYGCLITNVTVERMTKITEAEYLDAWREQLAVRSIVKCKDDVRIFIGKLRKCERNGRVWRMESGELIHDSNMTPPSPQEIEDYKRTVAPPEFEVGDYVDHDSYGVGIIMEIEEEGHSPFKVSLIGGGTPGCSPKRLVKITMPQYVEAWRKALGNGSLIKYKEKIFRVAGRSDHDGGVFVEWWDGSEVLLWFKDVYPPSFSEVENYNTKRRLDAELERMARVQKRIEEKGADSIYAWAKKRIEDSGLYADTYAKVHSQLLKSYMAWGVASPEMRAEAQAVTIMEIVQHPEKFSLLDKIEFDPPISLKEGEKVRDSWETWAEGTVEPPFICTSAEELADTILTPHNRARKYHKEELGKEGVQNCEDTYTILYDRLLEAFTAWCLAAPGLRAGSLAKTLTEMLVGGTEPDSKTRDHIAESATFLADMIKKKKRTQEYYIHNASIYLKVKDRANPVFWEYVEFAKITCETIEGVEPEGPLSTEKKELQHCEYPEHRGLTFRCPRRKPDTVCVVCLACDAESGDAECGHAIYDVVDDGDGNIEYKDFRMIEDDEEWRSIPEIPLDVYCYMMKLAEGDGGDAQPEDPPTPAPAEAEPGNKNKKKKNEEDKGAKK